MDIKVGDEVRITKPGSRYHGGGSPEGGYHGRVTKVGRKYAAAEYQAAGSSHPFTVEFSMETGIERGSVNSTYAVRVQTPGQAEQAARQGTARATLFTAGISVDGDWSRLTVEQWEALAAVAATLPEFNRSR